MCPLNFDNIHKFHLSVGAGLLVAAFFLIFTTNWIFYDKLDGLSNSILYDTVDKINEGNTTKTLLALNELDANISMKNVFVEMKKVETMRVNLEWTIMVGRWLMGFGFGFILLGYIGWYLEGTGRWEKIKDIFRVK